jgi:hypothetical protein
MSNSRVRFKALTVNIDRQTAILYDGSMAPSRSLTDGPAVNLAARELGKLSWRKRKAREDERNARLAELEAENVQLRKLLAGAPSNSKSR